MVRSHPSSSPTSRNPAPQNARRCTSTGPPRMNSAVACTWTCVQSCGDFLVVLLRCCLRARVSVDRWLSLSPGPSCLSSNSVESRCSNRELHDSVYRGMALKRNPPHPSTGSLINRYRQWIDLYNFNSIKDSNISRISSRRTKEKRRSHSNENARLT